MEQDKQKTSYKEYLEELLDNMSLMSNGKYEAFWTTPKIIRPNIDRYQDKILLNIRRNGNVVIHTEHVVDRTTENNNMVVEDMSKRVILDMCMGGLDDFERINNKFKKAAKDRKVDFRLQFGDD